MKTVGVIGAIAIFFIVFGGIFFSDEKAKRHGDWVVMWNDGSESKIAEPLLDSNFSEVTKGGKPCIRSGTSAVLVNDGRDVRKLKVVAVKRLKTNTPPFGTPDMIYEVCPERTEFIIP